MANIALTPIIEGTLAKASEVMGNFQAIADEVNGNLDESNLKDGIITSAKIVDGAVADTKLASGSVGTTALKNNSVTESKLATGSVSSSKIVDGAVSGSKIAGSTITADNLANGAVTTPKLDDRAVTSSKLDNSSVGTTKLSDGAVTGAKLGTNAVTESKLATDSVSTVKIQDGAVTNSKLSGTISAARLPTIPLYLLSDEFGVLEIYSGYVTSQGSLQYGRLPTGASIVRTNAERYKITNLGVGGGWIVVVTPTNSDLTYSTFPGPNEVIIDFRLIGGGVVSTGFSFILTRNVSVF